VIAFPESSTPMPPRNGHEGFLSWSLPTFMLHCRSCPGRRSGVPKLVDEWEAGQAEPSDRPAKAWEDHTSVPPVKRLPTLAELQAGRAA
jgi:hypothetical protein